MNSSVYVFGNFKLGYCQYPDDYTRRIFDKFNQISSASTQVIVHRDGSIMYYAYIRRFSNMKNWIGLCLVINGVMLVDLNKYFEICESMISQMIINELIKFNNKGEIIPAVDDLISESFIVEKVQSVFYNIFEASGITEKRLPPSNYSLDIDSVKKFSNDDDMNEICKATSEYAYTVIYKDKNYITKTEQGYNSILRNLNTDKNALIKENEQLKKPNKKIQTNLLKSDVIFLILIVLVCVIGIYIHNKNLNNVQDILEWVNRTISKKYGHSTNNENNEDYIEKQHSETTPKDERIKYNTSSVVSGWVALFDKKKQKRCYMSHDDYYSIKEPSLNGNLKEEYSFLIPLGMVLKYSGVNIIWGFEGVESISWKDANEYVNSYSPDGAKWRLLSKIEASAIDTYIFNFTKIFSSYYPNDLSYLGSYCCIENWTSRISDEVWVRKADGLSYNKVYTLDIYGDECKIQKEHTTYEEDFHNVYPISSL